MAIDKYRCKKCFMESRPWQLQTPFGVESWIITFCQDKRCKAYHRIIVVEGSNLETKVKGK